MQDRADAPNEFKPVPCPMVGQYNVQRFQQFSPEDCANWVIQKGTNCKSPFALYPTMGRQHINYLGTNQLIFDQEPRLICKSIDYWYAVVGQQVYQIDSNYELTAIGTVASTGGNVFFCYLVVNSIVFQCFTDPNGIYIYREDTQLFSKVTDPLAPGNFTVTNSSGINIPTRPGAIVAFGNRIAVAVMGSSQFVLAKVNLLETKTDILDPGFPAGSFNPNNCFHNPGLTPQVYAQADGVIQQMGVLNNTLYIFCDFITDVWSNIPSIFPGTGVTFPWKKNTTYNWNFGIADPLSLDIDFGFMVFLAQNSDGLLQVVASSGGTPEPISSKAVDVMFQNYSNQFGNNSPFLSGNAVGFLYQYENNIYYRLSGGRYGDTQLLDQEQQANSIEYSFENKSWSRCIELNGERNRIQRHIYFNNQHLVTVIGEDTVYQMSGQFYTNEVRDITYDSQDRQAYTKLPMQYERITPIIAEDDLSEFETEYVEIDFVFGDSFISFSNIFTPSEFTYNTVFTPHLELDYSDDGGVSFLPADVRVFSQQGQYIWKMRWYQLGTSRNRAYFLRGVSEVPIVILSAVMSVRRVSGGAN